MSEVDFSILDLPAESGNGNADDTIVDVGSDDGDVTTVVDPAVAEPVVVPDVEPVVADTTPTTPDLIPVEYESLTPRELALIERLEKVTGQRLDVDNILPADESVVAADTTVEPVVEHDFLAGQDIDEVLSTPENFNKLLQSVYARGIEQSSKLAAENILRNLPQVISQYVSQHMTMNERVNQFYETNPELRSVRRTVASVANEVAAENPELSLDDVFGQAAERTYKMLGLKHGESKSRTTTKTPKPALVSPRGGGNRVQEPKLQGLEAEIDELLDL